MRGSVKFARGLAFFCLTISLLFSSISLGIWFDVWDNPRQCHGDADGKKEMMYWVHANDLATLHATLPWPQYYHDYFHYIPAADFDRNLVIDYMDEAILEVYFQQTNVPADCSGKLRLHSMSNQIILAQSWYVISWDDLSGSCVDGNLSYSTNGGTSWTAIDPNYKNGCTCNWPVPDVNSQQCLIRIQYSGPEPNYPYTLTDTSSSFTIYQCLLETNSDWNGDCYIDFSDFAILGENWLIEPSGTDINDVNELSQNWLDCGNPYDPRCGAGI